MARKSRKETAAVPASQKPSLVYHSAAYIRLSSDAKRKPGDSLETQQDICPVKIHMLQIKKQQPIICGKMIS